MTDCSVGRFSYHFEPSQAASGSHQAHPPLSDVTLMHHLQEVTDVAERHCKCDAGITCKPAHQQEGGWPRPNGAPDGPRPTARNDEHDDAGDGPPFSSTTGMILHAGRNNSMQPATSHSMCAANSACCRRTCTQTRGNALVTTCRVNEHASYSPDSSTRVELSWR